MRRPGCGDQDAATRMRLPAHQDQHAPASDGAEGRASRVSAPRAAELASSGGAGGGSGYPAGGASGSREPQEGGGLRGTAPESREAAAARGNPEPQPKLGLPNLQPFCADLPAAERALLSGEKGLLVAVGACAFVATFVVASASPPCLFAELTNELIRRRCYQLCKSCTRQLATRPAARPRWLGRWPPF